MNGQSLAELVWNRLTLRMEGKIYRGASRLECDSPIETRFNRFSMYHISETVLTERQRWVKTDIGMRRLDFMFTSQCGTRVAVECDGKQWHDINSDSERDLAIIRAAEADRIIRFQGCNIHHNETDVMWLFSEFAPELFSEMKIAHLRSRAMTDTGRQMEVERLLGYTKVSVDRFTGEDFNPDRRFSAGCSVLVMDQGGPKTVLLYASKCAAFLSRWAKPDRTSIDLEEVE